MFLKSESTEIQTISSDYSTNLDPFCKKRIYVFTSTVDTSTIGTSNVDTSTKLSKRRYLDLALISPTSSVATSTYNLPYYIVDWMFSKFPGFSMKIVENG